MNFEDKRNFISRIAPTPSGYLHLGNGVNFLLTWIIVRSKKGVLHLRIDDIDTQRTKLKYIDNIFKTLEFLQIDWDYGPQNTSDYLKNYHFKHRYLFYANKIKYFYKKIPLIFPCNCSRSQINKKSPNGLYPLTCYKNPISYNKKNCSLRLHVKTNTFVKVDKKSAFLDKVMGDFIIWKKDDTPSYQFASLMDDEENCINLIIRGEDLLYSSMAQIYMSTIFNLKNFKNTRIIHHKLLLDNTGKKMSKSVKSESLLECKDIYQLYKKVAQILQLESGAEDNLHTLIEAFDAKYPLAFEKYIL